MANNLNRRAPNWSETEISLLVEGYAKRKEIIDGKLSPSITHDKKQKALQDLANDISAVSNGERTPHQVKKKLSDLKSEVKKKAAEMRRHREATGGGPPSKTSFTIAEDLLLSTMNHQLIDGIIEEGDTSVPAKEDSKEDQPVSPPLLLIEPQLLVETKTAQTPSTAANGCKRRRICDFEAKSTAEELLEVERQKVSIAEKLVSLKAFELSLRLKWMEASGLDVGNEREELKSFFN